MIYIVTYDIDTRIDYVERRIQESLDEYERAFFQDTYDRLVNKYRPGP